MQERFKQILRDKAITATHFAEKIHVNASAMSHILNGRSKPGFEILDKISQAFPDINLNWLISGKGIAYNNQESNTSLDAQLNLPIDDQHHNTKPVTEILQYPIDDNVDITKNSREEEIVRTLKDSNLNNSKCIKRIILFFDDETFESYEK